MRRYNDTGTIRLADGRTVDCMLELISYDEPLRDAVYESWRGHAILAAGESLFNEMRQTAKLELSNGQIGEIVIGPAGMDGQREAIDIRGSGPAPF